MGQSTIRPSKHETMNRSSFFLALYFAGTIRKMKWSSREESKGGKKQKYKKWQVLYSSMPLIRGTQRPNVLTQLTHTKSHKMLLEDSPTFYGSNNKKLSPSQKVVPVVNKDNWDTTILFLNFTSDFWSERVSSRWQSSIWAVNFTVSWCGIFVFFPFLGISVNNKNRRGTFTLSDGKLNNSVGTIIRGQSEISGEKWWGAAGFSLIPSANTSHMDGGTCSDSLSRVSSSFTHPLSCFILFFFSFFRPFSFRCPVFGPRVAIRTALQRLRRVD